MELQAQVMGGKNTDQVKAGGVTWQFVGDGIGCVEVFKNCVQNFGSARVSREVAATCVCGECAQIPARPQTRAEIR